MGQLSPPSQQVTEFTNGVSGGRIRQAIGLWAEAAVLVLRALNKIYTIGSIHVINNIFSDGGNSVQKDPFESLVAEIKMNHSPFY